MESGLLGLSATLLAIPVGLVLSLILVHVINLRSSGWSLDWNLQPWEITKAAAVAARGLGPGQRLPIWRINSSLKGSQGQSAA